ncbi:MAG TPA: hypothetical protein VE960_02895, partial [bacterium]|nr:hypothetical protein [bacterium]
NVNLYDDNETLRGIFDSVTPDFGSTKNPIDLTGGATSPDFTGALNAALEHDEIDAVISLYCETAVFDADNLSKMIEESSAKYSKAGKPVVFSIFGGETTEAALDTLTKKGVPVFGDVYETVACLGGLYRHWRNAGAPAKTIVQESIDEAAINRIVDGAREDCRSFLLAQEGRDVLAAAGIRMPDTRVAKSMD